MLLLVPHSNLGPDKQSGPGQQHDADTAAFREAPYHLPSFSSGMVLFMDGCVFSPYNHIKTRGQDGSINRVTNATVELRKHETPCWGIRRLPQRRWFYCLLDMHELASLAVTSDTDRYFGGAQDDVLRKREQLKLERANEYQSPPPVASPTLKAGIVDNSPGSPQSAEEDEYTRNKRPEHEHRDQPPYRGKMIIQRILEDHHRELVLTIEEVIQTIDTIQITIITMRIMTTVIEMTTTILQGADLPDGEVRSNQILREVNFLFRNAPASFSPNQTMNDPFIEDLQRAPPKEPEPMYVPSVMEAPVSLPQARYDPAAAAKEQQRAYAEELRKQAEEAQRRKKEESDRRKRDDPLTTRTQASEEKRYNEEVSATSNPYVSGRRPKPIDSKEEHQNYLRQQAEDKKRREAEEKQREIEEDKKMEERLKKEQAELDAAERNQSRPKSRAAVAGVSNDDDLLVKPRPATPKAQAVVEEKIVEEKVQPPPPVVEEEKIAVSPVQKEELYKVIPDYGAGLSKELIMRQIEKKDKYKRELKQAQEELRQKELMLLIQQNTEQKRRMIDQISSDLGYSPAPETTSPRLASGRIRNFQNLRSSSADNVAPFRQADVRASISDDKPLDTESAFIYPDGRMERRQKHGSQFPSNQRHRETRPIRQRSADVLRGSHLENTLSRPEEVPVKHVTNSRQRRYNEAADAITARAEERLKKLDSIDQRTMDKPDALQTLLTEFVQDDGKMRLLTPGLISVRESQKDLRGVTETAFLSPKRR
ncbi:trichohyalin [Planoprotostelium fungivorum]|uniref:Trichohyalin n=1 Tax=Planoprotostelium fungivorum TaxID=1890364 RepID=A0A2P6N2Z7_9EUKA|nr:trichohyalin [Planoprotostelium fungivorum]